MFLNDSKTQFIVFSARNRIVEPIQNPQLNGSEICRVETALFLGVTFDSTLNWRSHVNTLCPKLSSSLYLLRTMSFYTDREMLLRIYYGLIESKLRYGIICWGNSPDSIRAFRLQKQAIRALCGVEDQMESCRPLFEHLRILPLPSLYILELLVHTYRHLADYRKVTDVHSVNTRSRGNLYVESYRLSTVANGPSSMGIRLFNKLPETYKSGSLSAVNFRSKVKSMLLSNCFYSVHEFLSA